jgi:NADP-dependent 3-hydroxy acid dehydrogenase YdfG
MAIEMAALGWKIAIGARRHDRLAETAEKARAAGAQEVYAGPLDVTDADSVDRFFEASEKAIGVADVIVNNAGGSTVQWVEETDARRLASEVKTNLIGPMLVTHRALAPLLAANSEGDVLMVSSDAAKRPRPAQLAYGASKAGLENYADALGMSLEGTGIRVIKLRVGPALSEFGLAMDLTPEGTRKRTDYWNSFGLRDARMMTKGTFDILMPEDVARAAVHAITQPRHILLDTIEIQPAAKKTGGEST